MFIEMVVFCGGCEPLFLAVCHPLYDFAIFAKINRGFSWAFLRIAS